MGARRTGARDARGKGGLLTCMCMSTSLWAMRTTIELPDEQRAKLLELAARRGEKGFSKLVQEAVAEYLADAAHDEGRIEIGLGRAGHYWG